MTNLCLDKSFKIFIIFSLLNVSKAPVGSSAKIIFVLVRIVLAIATRCFSPPLKYFTFFVIILSMFNLVINLVNLLEYIFLFVNFSGNSILSFRLRFFIKL